MKLAALALISTLGLGGIAAADPAGPAPHPRGELRQLLLQRFDRDHDGMLDSRERRSAIRALRRIARRMAMQERREELRDHRLDRRDERRQEIRNTIRERREERMRRLVERYDRNRDGVVSPDEMPSGMAHKLRPLDRNHDGWLDDTDQPPAPPARAPAPVDRNRDLPPNSSEL